MTNEPLKLKLRGTKSNKGSPSHSPAGSPAGSPASSPASTRKVHNLSHSPFPPEVLIDVTGDKTPIRPDSKTHCPCKSSDPESTYVVCMKCDQRWHQNCSNLIGVSSQSIKKMIKWECPFCYKCPLVPSPKTLQTSLTDSDMMSCITGKMAEIQNTLQASDEDISSQLHSLKIQMNDLANLPITYNNRDASEDVSQQLADIRKQFSEISCSKPSPSAEEMETIKQLLPVEKINNLEENILQLFNKIDRLEEKIDTSNSSSSNKLPSKETSDDVSTGPNTESPHAKASTPPCDPYTGYHKDAITAELKTKIMAFVEEKTESFKTVGTRDLIYYGEYGYWYSGARHDAARMPDVIEDLFDAVRSCRSDTTSWINSCLVTRYTTGKSSIPPHRDDELFIDPESEIVTVSLGAKRTMTFTDNSQNNVVNLDLEDGSVYTMSRYSQDFWKHSIDEDESVDETRYSFTFRHIAPHFSKSTVLIGDSNTKNAKFGHNKGEFGRWLPGKRVEAFRIETIPKPEDIGPFRNVVIHTGINDIRFGENRKSNKSLVNDLEKKCMEISEVYPRSKIFVSLLLPTKAVSLNRTVTDFNNRILDMTYKHRNLSVIEHSVLVDSQGCLDKKFGRFVDGRPNQSDAIHLGRFGTARFCTNIKETLMKRKSGYIGEIAKSRFNGSSGNFVEAVERGTKSQSST